MQLISKLLIGSTIIGLIITVWVIFMWQKMRTPVSSISSSETSTQNNTVNTAVQSPVLVPTPIIPALQCAEVVQIAKEFYETKGEWAGVYTMTPLNNVKVNDSTCDISYVYKNILNGQQGNDKRRFTFTFSNGENKFIVSKMGPYQSGTSNSL